VGEGRNTSGKEDTNCMRELGLGLAMCLKVTLKKCN
jgi:hypothetical protein